MRNCIPLAQSAILIIGWIVPNAHTLRDFAGLGSEHFSVYGVGRTKRSPWRRISIICCDAVGRPKLPLACRGCDRPLADSDRSFQSVIAN